jgi:YidC/Oxa1 family membrane protein insertase
MYNEYIFRPLYNGLVGILDILPWADVGVAVFIFTVIVKLILYPLSKSAILTQMRMKEIEPEANRIRNQYPTDKQLQAMKLMELYKTKNVKPFSGILLLFIQLPILFALISVFYKVIPEIDATLLYSFISVPEVKTNFLGLGIIDLTQPSLILAIVTAVVQYFQRKYSLASKQIANQKNNNTPTNPLMASMNSMTSQMKYFIPVLAFVSIYWIIPTSFPQAASIVGIYWATSALMTLLQELYIGRKYTSIPATVITK